MTLDYGRFLNSDWKFLIILDACRYDYFSRMFECFFDGDLVKLRSLGSCTTEWFINTFTRRFKETIYISANPYITSIYSSTGLDFRKKVFRINAKRFFYKIVDVWRFGWEDKLGTVHPRTVSAVALHLSRRYPEKRFIVHYLQPHAPFIGSSVAGYPRSSIEQGQTLSNLASQRRLRIVSILTRALNLSYHMISKELFAMGLGNLYFALFKEALKLPASSPLDLERRKYGIEGLRKAYEKNLRIVLAHVAMLVSNLKLYSHNIVVTSDHGEFLGEKGMLGHPRGNSDPIVRSVPWLNIEKVKGKWVTAKDVNDMLRFSVEL